MGFFITGSVRLVSQGRITTWGKVSIQAGGGGAFFAIVFLTWPKELPVLKGSVDDAFAQMQPLTSLHFKWEFSSTDPALWNLMRNGEQEIRENAESSQGGVPRIPFEAMDYNAALIPLLSYIAKIGPSAHGTDVYEPSSTNSFVVLMPLDESRNAVLSFGRVEPEVTWYDGGEPFALSSGSTTSKLQKEARSGKTIPSASTTLGKSKTDESKYCISWDLDPLTLANSVDRINSAILPTAKLPELFKIALFYEIRTLPFREGDFANSLAVSLWTAESYLIDPIDIKKRSFKDMRITIRVNGNQKPRCYSLKRIYGQRIEDQYSDSIDTQCVILDFEML
jgi:hypothetical protein